MRLYAICYRLLQYYGTEAATAPPPPRLTPALACLTHIRRQQQHHWPEPATNRHVPTAMLLTKQRGRGPVPCGLSARAAAARRLRIIPFAAFFTPTRGLLATPFVPFNMQPRRIRPGSWKKWDPPSFSSLGRLAMAAEAAKRQYFHE